MGAKELASACRAFKTAEKTLILESLAESTGNLYAAAGTSSEVIGEVISKTDKFKTAGKIINNTGIAGALANSTTKILGNSYKSLGEITVPIKNTEVANYLNKLSK